MSKLGDRVYHEMRTTNDQWLGVALEQSLGALGFFQKIIDELVDERVEERLKEIETFQKMIDARVEVETFEKMIKERVEKIIEERVEDIVDCKLDNQLETMVRDIIEEGDNG